MFESLVSSETIGSFRIGFNSILVNELIITKTVKIRDMRLFITLLLLLFSRTQSLAQNEGLSYVKIIVEGVNTSEESLTIDDFIRSQEGVKTSRMDKQTSLYFGIYYNDSGLTLADFESWIESLGFEVECSLQGGFGNSEVIKELTKDMCD